MCITENPQQKHNEH
jgi:hypothetical protein